MKPRTRARTPSSIASNQSSKSKPSAATTAPFVVSFVMAWSPFQRANAGIIWVEQPGDYAGPIPTTSATGPDCKDLKLAREEKGELRYDLMPHGLKTVSLSPERGNPHDAVESRFILCVGRQKPRARQAHPAGVDSRTLHRAPAPRCGS